MTDWVRTDDLLDRLPASRRVTASMIKTTFLGKKELPPEIPMRKAIALAAYAQARARGFNRAGVFDLVANASGSVAGMLVVVRSRGTLRLVRAASFKPIPGVFAIDLDQVVELIESGADIPA